MRILYWRILVGLVIAIALVSFLLIFSTGATQPTLGNVPYIFWSSFFLTVLLVVLTYLGSKIFPYKDEQS